MSMEKQTIEIERFGADWYNFEKIPQEHRYVKIHNLRHTTDRKALNSAKKINPNFNYKIKHTVKEQNNVI